MESSSQSLSTIESFSHSWLPISSSSSCANSFDAADEASFIEMDPKMPSSRRFSRVPKDFSFDFRTTQFPVSLAHADDLISPDGVLVPLSGEFPLINTPAACASDDIYDYRQDIFVAAQHESGSPNTSIMNSTDKKEKTPSNRVRCASLRRCKRLSERIFQKYLSFLKPICRKLQGRGSCTSRVASVGSSRGALMYEEPNVGDEAGRSWEYNSPATSPRTSVAWSIDNNWRRSCDSESSIYEAVLHCKRTHHGK